MPTEPFKRERAAQIIAESVSGGIEPTCKKYGISRRTMEHWKKQISDGDKEFAQIVVTKMAVVEKDWIDDLPGAICAAVDFLKRAAADADTKDPQVIYSVAGALKILTDVTMSRRILDTRLAKVALLNAGPSTGMNAGDSRTDRPVGEAPGQGDSGQPPDQLGLQ